MADLSFHPDAAEEYQAALTWYLGRSQAAAVRLTEELDRTIESVRQFPEMYPLFDDRHRYAVLRRYPYSVVYRMDGDRIRVVAFAHSRRSSGYWQGRA